MAITNFFRTYAGVHITSFKDFLLKDELKKALSNCGFEHPSEVQQQCLPNSLLGVDVLCQAKSGMGKTAVFVLTVLNSLTNESPAFSVLVLAHARELAYQIAKEFDRFSTYLNYKTVLIYGGEDKEEQITRLKNDQPKIVVGTPGRMLEFVKRKIIDLSNIKVFILDECDKMLQEVGELVIQT